MFSSLFILGGMTSVWDEISSSIDKLDPHHLYIDEHRLQVR